jgi:hypothetical protein
LGGLLLGISVAVGTANAAITPSRDPVSVAKAIAQTPSLVTSAEFVNLPPGGVPAAVASTPLGGFPRSGGTYAILSSGNAAAAETPNYNGEFSTRNGGPATRGARDVVTLRIGLTVPAGRSCLSFRLRFYAEEFPEFVGSQYNDAFIAELDKTTWDASGTSNPSITAPDNFAKDELGRNISVNAAGVASVSAGLASGTTYDAATQALRAWTPITPGPHNLYLTIFAQGDDVFDSSVLLDRLSVNNQTPCVAGLAADLSPGAPAGAIGVPNGRVSVPASQLFPPSRLRINAPRSAYKRVGRNVRLSASVSDNFGFLVRGARFTARSVPTGLLRPVAGVTRMDGKAAVTLRPTAKLRARGAGLVDVYLCARKNRESETRGISLCRLSQFPYRP